MSHRALRRSALGGSQTRSRQSVLVTGDDAYSYALRCAYLAYLLQPRPRRQVPAPPPPQVHRSSTSFHDLMRDFSTHASRSKGIKFPKGFLPALQPKLESVWMGREQNVEYKDVAVKRTFAVFYTAFKEPRFYEGVAKSRRVEDLVLIFYSSATKELQKIKQDDSWKWLADRHVALFVRLMYSVIRDHGYMGSHPELATQLATLEAKLLQHDQNLAEETRGASATMISAPPAPLSYDVKDMPLVRVVARVFGTSLQVCQQDINRNKSTWTEKAALMDMKAYSNNLSLSNTRRTLRSDDFDTDEAWEAWRKLETPALSQLMLAIVQSNPAELARTTSGSSPVTNRQSLQQQPTSYPMPYRDLSRSSTSSNATSDATSIYGYDQPVDMDAFSGVNPPGADDTLDTPYTYIPPDPRAYYRYVVEKCLVGDLQDPDAALLTKSSLDLLNECCTRWRIPPFSRAILFLDAIRKFYQEQLIDLATLDAAWVYAKESTEVEWQAWALADQNLYRQILSTVHDTLLRELYDLLQHAFDPKTIPTGRVMYILDKRIYEDPLFTSSNMESYIEQLKVGLQKKAEEVLEEIVSELPDRDELDPFHLVELTQKIVKLTEKIDRRFKEPIMGSVDPMMIFVEVVFPHYGSIAKEIVLEIMQAYQEKDQEVEIEDGFDLYKELSEIRRIYNEAYPKNKFPVHLEDFLAEFVWRWIKNTDGKVIGWVDEAIKHDDFTLKVREEQGREPTDDERHTMSVVDIFRSFNQTVDYIKKLEWKDDIQHGRFMTALAKILGSGVARYCEVLEKLFTYEMDRQTPEQEAAALQTRQQRWMAMARDAWSNKDKIEPFQFAPESCVKLNNIEFAINQLDKLEHSVDVDGIAATLAPTAPPIGQKKKASNYVFTIKIVEAEDLKAMDLSGFSDPYVVLGDEYQKRLAKTRVIYANLNPRWEETVDITTQGPIWLTATVWDWDTVGDHDCVGRTSIKLEPSNFSDFLPKEYWLDLDTQGRLLLRVSMEGERDDIQFYFGRAFRTLKRTERDMTRQITDKLSAYIHHCLSRSALKSVLSKGYSISAVSSLFSRTGLGGARPVSTTGQGITEAEIAAAVVPLTDYFNENFAILNQTLTSTALTLVMSKLWKEVLVTIEGLLVPTLSDKPSQQKQLSTQETEVVFKWLQLMFDFFHAIDEQTGEATGVPIDVLRSPKYHELQSLNFFYFESTENLIRTSERMANAAAARQQQARQRLTDRNSGGSSLGGFLGVPGMQRQKSVLMSRNLGTMRKVKEEKRREAQAEPSDDMILRILRMRPEAATYLKDRNRQKERLAASAAAAAIVEQSMNSGGGRMGSIAPGGPSRR